MTVGPDSFKPLPTKVRSRIDFAAELNADQLAAVQAGTGPHLVLAGAGSGKTRTLTYRVAWLLEQGVSPWQILLLTFTNKAAKEMLERVEDLCGVPRREFWGGTFHSFGQRILRRHGDVVGVGSNFTIMDEGDAETLMTQVIREANPEFLKEKGNPKARLIGDYFSYARNTRRTLEAVVRERAPWLMSKYGVLKGFVDRYTAVKRERQLVDYDDLLELPLDVFEKDSEVLQHYQRRFDYILVDEYQDTNRIQSELIDRLADRHQVMAVGDDAQCIYTWRGAEFENIITFPERHPGTVIHKIEVNYRSSPEILRFANGILSYEPDRSGFRKELRAVRDSNQPPYFVPTIDTRHQAQLTARRIRRLIGEEGYRASDIAVLYRAHYQAMDLQMELTRQNVPYVITSGVRFFEQAHVRDFVAQLRIAANPDDSPAFMRLVQLLPRVGERTAARIYTLARQTAATDGLTFAEALGKPAVREKVPQDAIGDWDSLVATLIELEAGVHGAAATSPGGTRDLFAAADRANAVAGTPAEVVRLALDGWYGDFLRTLHSNWQERMEDLESLIAFADRFESVSDFLAELVLLNSETGNRSIDPDVTTVRLTTVHQAKGLEFPVVFIIGLADGLFPLRRAMEEGNLDEERRLFYVASTRAKDELYLFYPQIVASGGPPGPVQPSVFVRELDPGSFEVIRV